MVRLFIIKRDVNSKRAIKILDYIFVLKARKKTFLGKSGIFEDFMVLIFVHVMMHLFLEDDTFKVETIGRLLQYTR